MTNRQVELVLDVLRDVLERDLVGVYVFGSAVLGALRPRSDLDLMAVSKRPTTKADKQRLVDQLLNISLRPRPVELTIVIEAEIRPWRYPPRMDFQYGDWWRDEFERGELTPWGSATNPDLASLIRMVLLANATLHGPAPAEIFDPIPRGDYVHAMKQGIDQLLQDLESDTRNVILTLARMWSGVLTDEVLSKDDAADWALARLPEVHRQLLAHARATYLGEEQDRWETLWPQVRAYAEYVVAEIRSSV